MRRRKIENRLAEIASKLRTKKYAGELARPRRRRPEYIGTLYDPDPPALLMEHSRGLDLLLKHYNIPPTSQNRWLRLAYGLAKEHVPFFRLSTSGRPKSEKEFYKEIRKELGLAPRRRGQPRKHGGPLEALSLVTKIEHYKKELAPKLRRRVTDIDVIDYLTAKAEQKTGRSFAGARTAERRYWQKRISTARRLIKNSQ